jgi:hypothetical protein
VAEGFGALATAIALPGRWVVSALGFAAGLLAATHTPADSTTVDFWPLLERCWWAGFCSCC